MKLSNQNTSGVTPSDGIDVFLCVGDYDGGVALETFQKTLLKFPKKQ